jgi:hypothetical protein
MKALKGILVGLIVLLVVILVAGGAMVGFNHSGHQSDDNNMVMNDSTKDNASKESTEQNTVKEHTMQPDDNKDKANDKQTESKDASNEDNKQPVVLVQEQVSPEEYLKKMQSAMDLVKQGTGLMANAPYMANSGNPGDLKGPSNNQADHNSVDMSKIHEGIYKIAQGNTLMDQSLQAMDLEIKKAKANNMSFYQIQPQIPQYYLTPYGYLQPQGYNPYMQNIQPQYNQGQQNNQSQNSPSNTQNAQGSSNHVMSGGFSIANIFSVKNITLVIYGLLLLSLMGMFIAIFGFVNSFFKKTTSGEQRGENVAG